MHVFIGKRDGQVTNFHLIHYGTRAAGQVGLVMIEATAVLPEGRISNKDLGIWDNSLIEGLHKTTTFIHDNGAKVAIQLAHAGRKAELETDALAPSAIPFNETMKMPIEMSKHQIKDTVLAFQQAQYDQNKLDLMLLKYTVLTVILLMNFFLRFPISGLMNMVVHLKTAIVSYAKSLTR